MLSKDEKRILIKIKKDVLSELLPIAFDKNNCKGYEGDDVECAKCLLLDLGHENNPTRLTYLLEACISDRADKDLLVMLKKVLKRLDAMDRDAFITELDFELKQLLERKELLLTKTSNEEISKTHILIDDEAIEEMIKTPQDFQILINIKFTDIEVENNNIGVTSESSIYYSGRLVRKLESVEKMEIVHEKINKFIDNKLMLHLTSARLFK
jgi:hypothetical protein